MPDLQPFYRELAVANRILAHEGILDSFGHVSMRHPAGADRFLLSRARSPQCVEAGDIMEYEAGGEPVEASGRSSYLERYIHAAIYQSRPDVHAVVHSHSQHTIALGVCGIPIRPILHNSSVIGHEVPIWDSRTRFGDTAMVVPDMEMARDLAGRLGNGAAVLMRGHGNTAVGRTVRRAVFVAIKLDESAQLQLQAMRLGEPVYMSRGEVDLVNRAFDEIDDRPLVGIDRAWEYWCARAGLEYCERPR